MCGIIAYAGKSIETFNKDKFNILGIYNDSRGGDGCGVSIDGKLYKGLEKNKLFSSFITNRTLPTIKEDPIVIGHTRKSSVGIKNFFNTHPFSFKNNSNSIKSDFIGVHNGTLHNYKELAKEYNIEDYDMYEELIPASGSTLLKRRTKIDSEILLEILYSSNDYTILEKYNGGAALVWYNPKEPNVLYCFHGESKLYPSGNKAFDERPLYYYKESENSLYISSLENSLYAIGGNIETVDEFEFNTVYKITDGDIENAEKTKIDRSKSYQNNVYSSSNYGYSDYVYGWDGYEGTNVYYNRRLSERKKKKEEKKEVKNYPTLLNIHTEETELPVNDYKGKIYFNKLRYKRNNHNIDGIYTYIKGYGFYLLGDQYEDAKNTFIKITNQYFDGKEFIGDNKLDNNDFIPFVNDKNNLILTFPFYYFYKGIMLRTELDYTQLTYSKDDSFTIEALSHASKHPICRDGFEAFKNQNIMYNGELYNGRFTVLGSERHYNIEKGNLISYNKVNESFNIISTNNLVSTKEANKVQKDLIEIITNDLKNENSTKNEDTLLMNDVNKMLLNFYTSLPSMVKQIEKYEKSPKRDAVLDSFQTILYEIDEIVNLEENTTKND